MSGVRRRIAKTVAGCEGKTEPPSENPASGRDRRRVRRVASRRVAWNPPMRRAMPRAASRAASAAASRRDAVHAASNPPSLSAGGKKTLEKSRAASRAAETRRDGARATRERDEEGAGAHRQDSPFGMVLDVAVCVASASQRDRAGARCRSFSLSFSLRPDWREKRVPVRNLARQATTPPPSSPPPPPVLHAATLHGRPRRRHQPQQRPALQVRRVGVHQEPASARGPRVLAPHVRRRAVARYTVSTAGGGREARAERRDDRDDDDDDDDDDARRRRRRHGRRGDLSRDAGHPARPPHPARRLREANAGRARGEDAASDSPGRAVLVASRRVPPGRARGVLARPRRGSRRRREKAAAAAAAARRRHGRPGRARAEDGGAPTPSGRGGAVAPRAVERLRWRHERGGHGPGRGASARAPVPVEDFLSPPARNSFLFSPPVVPRFRRSVSTLGFDARFRRLRPSTLDTHQGEDAHEEDLSRVPGLLVPYNGPSPPSGHHRYVFVLFEQTDDAEVRADGRGVEEPAACRRKRWDFKKFLEQNPGLRPRAVNYFVCSRERH